MRAAFRTFFTMFAVFFAALEKFASSFYKVATWVDQESGNLLTEETRKKAELDLAALTALTRPAAALPAPTQQSLQ